jgi:cytochrome oxidase Cu insertion factor (SCO1/SenC/PrrC family)
VTGTRRRRWWLPGAVLWLLVAGAGGLWIVHQRTSATLVSEPDGPLPVLGSIPFFELTERSGRDVTLADLSGRVWVATFFFSRCQDTCALQNARLARLQADFAGTPDLRLVSISVDPAHDTPAVLRQYAERLGADAERWLFLTGDLPSIVRLAQESFRVSVIVAPSGRPAADPAVTSHSPGLVLVDQETRIRGYYHSEDPADAVRLRDDVTRLRQARRLGLR